MLQRVAIDDKLDAPQDPDLAPWKRMTTQVGGWDNKNQYLGPALVVPLLSRELTSDLARNELALSWYLSIYTSI